MTEKQNFLNFHLKFYKLYFFFTLLFDRFANFLFFQVLDEKFNFYSKKRNQVKDGKGGKQKEDILYYYSKKIDNYNKNDKIEDEDENDDENGDKNENDDENERETENYFDENDHESDCY